MIGDKIENVGKLMVIMIGLMMVMMAIPQGIFQTTEKASAGEVLNDISGATYAQSKGYDGAGILIGEVGTGLDTGDNATLFGDFAGRVEHFVDWTEADTSDGIAEDVYGMSTPFISWMAGADSTGQFDPVDGKLYGQGMAPGASILVERVFDDGGGWAVGDVADVFTDAAQRGSYALTNSWGGGSTGEYLANSNKIDTAARDADPITPGDQPLLNFMACGNLNLVESACAKNSITVGVSEGYKPHKSTDADNIEELWGITAIGPTADGRIKPDIVAPATWGAGARSHDPGAVGFPSLENINADYLYNSGSGGSSAIACGAGAVFAQYYNDINGAIPSPAMTRAAMIDGATDMGTPDIPNSNEGWGRLNLTNMIDPGHNIFYGDQNVLLETGTNQLYDTINVIDASQPLNITVAWTDVAASESTGTGKSLINDIDLLAISPSGWKYTGNMFISGWSLFGVLVNDHENNVECVFVQAPELGQWTIWVNGTDIQQDALAGTVEVDQDYAIVISGLFDMGGGPIVNSAYADPNPTNGAATIMAYASFSDAQNVVDAEYFIDATGDNGTGISMIPVDGTFDGPDEDAFGVLDIVALGWLPGEIHTVYVHALDSDTEWGDFFPITIYVGTQYYLHVQNSIGADMSLWTIAPDEGASFTNSSGLIPASGQYQIGTAWMTDAMLADTGVGGTWRFFMDGYITTPLTGNLYAKVFDYPSMTQLNPAPTACTEDVSGFYSYHRFVWTDVIPANTISTGNRVYVEIWLDATSGGTAPMNDHANSDIWIDGVVEWNYPETLTSDNDYEEITEELFNQGASPNDDYDHLEHKWTFDVTGGSSVTFYLEAFESGASGLEDFVFAYSDDDVSYTDMFTVTKTADDDSYQTYVLPVSTTGTVYIRVLDTVFNTGTNEAVDTIYVDHMYIASLQSEPEFILGYDHTLTPSRIIVPEASGPGDNPPVSSCSYSGASPTGASPITIDWTATDDIGLIEVELFYQIDGGGYASWADASNPAPAAGTASGGSWSFDFPDGQGVYDLYTRALDDNAQVEAIPGVPDITVEYAVVITYDIPVSIGWNFISFPTEIVPSPITTILDDSINGDGNTEWNLALWYDPNDAANHWKSYNKNYLGTQDMPIVSNEMGIWLNVTQNIGDGVLTIGVGGPDPDSKSFMLYAGWNLIGYPSLNPQLASDTLPPEVTRMAYYDIGHPYLINDTVALDTVMMSHGNAYWVYSESNVLWQVETVSPTVGTMPYQLAGTVYLYDGMPGIGYDPLTSTGGAPVTIEWFNPSTGMMDSQNAVTDLLGRYLFMINGNEYYIGDEIYVNATFDAPYSNNGYNYTSFLTDGGFSLQNVTCGIPYEVIIVNPLPFSVQFSGLAFQVDYEFYDRDGMLAQGYYTHIDGAMEWMSTDPTFFPPPGGIFDGTASPFAGTGSEMIMLTTPDLFAMVELSEGGFASNMFLTPWGEFYIDPAGTIPGWGSDWTMVQVNVML